MLRVVDDMEAAIVGIHVYRIAVHGVKVEGIDTLTTGLLLHDANFTWVRDIDIRGATAHSGTCHTKRARAYCAMLTEVHSERESNASYIARKWETRWCWYTSTRSKIYDFTSSNDIGNIYIWSTY